MTRNCLVCFKSLVINCVFIVFQAVCNILIALPQFWTDSFYHKSSAKRYYGRQAELPSRDRRSAEYVSRVDKSYRNGYPSRGSGNFANPSRSVSHSQARSQYVDKMSEHRFARTPSSHYNGHAHDYESYSGLKRRHSELVSKFFETLNLNFYLFNQIWVSA